MHRKEIIPLERLLEQKYAEILCYPRYEQKEAEKRLHELERLRVKALEFAGDKKAFDLHVLGKGYVGIVVVAHTSTGKRAIKIRRIDADRIGMQHEAEMLKRANDVGIGPKLFDVTDNFLLMQFIDGTRLPKWITALRGRGTTARIQKTLCEILKQCWQLDEAGLDHGELSNAPKHIIVEIDDTPYIVDFETASCNRKASNVTSICQYLFIGSQLAKTIGRKLREIETTRLIHTLRIYKQEQTKENLENILVACGLERRLNWQRANAGSQP